MTSGDVAWLGLAAYVIGYDAWAWRTGHETMSASYGRALDDPHRRWPTLIFWGYLVGHLTRALPPRTDPLRKIPPHA